MSTPALRHFVEEALGKHAETLDDWFPSCFHWQGLCADTPAMAANLTDHTFDPDDLEANEEIRARADKVFRFAHVTALAILSAACVEDDNPVEMLDLMIEEPEEGEEAYFQGLVTEVLGALEQAIAGEEVVLDERGEMAYGLVNTAWPTVEDFVHEDGIMGDETQPIPGRDDAEREAVRSVLQSLILIATILAAFRWASVGR